MKSHPPFQTIIRLLPQISGMRFLPVFQSKVIPLARANGKKQSPNFSNRKTITMTKIFQLIMLLAFSFAGQQTANAQCQVTRITSDNDLNVVYTCPQDGNPDVVNFSNTNTSGSNYAYAITDADKMILAIETNGFFDFDNAPPGNCLVWGFSYTGNLTAQAGSSVFSTQFSDGCYSISQNYVSVIRETPNGGTVATPTGETSIYACLNDGFSDFVGFSNTSNSSANYRYVITDDQNNILGLPPTAFLDFSGAGVGTCRVWGLSYTGNLTAAVGQNAATVALSDNCFELSSNFITVDRNEVDGGRVTMPNGNVFREVTVQDGTPDVVMFVNTSTAPANYAYAITNESNEILEITTDAQMDFDGAPPGTCRVWGFSYSGAITAQAGESVFGTFSSGCYEISSSAITVYRRAGNPNAVDGGMVAMPSGATTRYTCPGDGIDDIVMFTTTSASTNYTYVITDDQNNILGLPPTNSQNFEGAGVGVCRVWGLAFTGNITAAVGDNAAAIDLSDDQFELSSNYIEIVRDMPDGGTVAMPSGATERYTCTQDGNADVVMFTHQTNSRSQYRYVITDDQNNILGLPPGDSNDFDGAPAGTCRVWGLSYTGMITAAVGDNAADVALTNGCFDLSDNFITIVRDQPEGGTVATADGETEVELCAGDGIDDIIEFSHQGNSNSKFAYVITDDQNNILGLPSGNSQNFEGAGGGVCRVWGLSYTGNLLVGPGDNAATATLTDDCFDLSDNFINVVRTGIDGGTVAMPDGETTRYTCAQDGNADVIMFTHTTTSTENYGYIITDDQNNILGIPPGDFADVDGAPPGNCRVWGFSYTGTVLVEMGDNAATSVLTDGCFALSSNFIEVIRDNPEGGTVETTDGETSITIVAGDGIDDIVEFTHAGNSNSNFTYVITDDQNNILGIPPGNSQNFEGAGVGVCRVWGLSYTGTITAEVGDNAADIALTDDCFDLSDNFIEVTRAAQKPISNIVFAKAAVSPNPVLDQVNLELKMEELPTEEMTKVSVYNTAGVQVHFAEFTTWEGANNFQMNLGHLREGIYKVVLQNGQTFSNLTFVKNRF